VRIALFSSSLLTVLTSLLLAHRWIPFDQNRNFPDLGSRFSDTERIARGRLLAAKLAANPSASLPTIASGSGSGPSPTRPGERVQLKPTPPVRAPKEEGYKWGEDERDFDDLDWSDERVEDEPERDLPWSAVLKRTFEAFVRGETPNMYGEWINWNEEDEDEGY
jgi:WD repeat and SOF domain-containing protein 1